MERMDIIEILSDQYRALEEYCVKLIERIRELEKENENMRELEEKNNINLEQRK